MNPIHRPSQLQAIVFFFFTLALAAAIVAWTFFINKGKARVEGLAPFVIKVGAKNMKCSASPCTIKLSPRTYTLRVTKEGFYDQLEKVEIKRGEEIVIQVIFQFIPQLHENSKLVLPLSNAPLRPPFLGQDRFENLPRNIINASFSPSSNKILINLGRELYVYDVQNRSTEEVSLPIDTIAAWLGEEIIYLANEAATFKEDGQTLNVLHGKKSEVLFTFDRPFRSPKLYGAPTADKILINEELQEGMAYYLIDTLKKSRKRLELPNWTVNPVWTQGYIVFEETNRPDKKVFAINADTFKKLDLPAIDSENVFERMPDSFVFVSETKLDREGETVSVSISEALEQAKKETSTNTSAKRQLFISELNIKTGVARTLVEVPIGENESIHKLTYDKSSDKIYFWKGEKVFEISLTPNA